MRVVSLVPSWTETLLEAGVDVVGRTRFCCHPSERVRGIPVVGGTKDLQAEACAALGADLILVDREENPKEFLSHLKAPVVDTHVDSVAALARELDRLAEVFNKKSLSTLADRARAMVSHRRSRPPERLPGLLEELTPYGPAAEIRYIIWREPWMEVGPGTYIESVLDLLGFRRAAPAASGKYPVLPEADLGRGYPLYSSEPFPFARKAGVLKSEGRTGAVVDGEGYSWFGVRGIRFLEDALSAP